MTRFFFITRLHFFVSIERPAFNEVPDTLPAWLASFGLSAESVKHDAENGVLSITIPVSERAKPRRIQVKTASQEQTAIKA